MKKHTKEQVSKVSKLTIIGALGALWLAGCATDVPEIIRRPPPGEPAFAEVQSDPATNRGQRVRWGGSILSVQNRASESWLEILSRPLDGEGRPKIGATSTGRFLVRVVGFVDPAVYATDREITVVGQIEGGEIRDIGGFRYTYVVINSDSIFLWPIRQERTADRYYDPWWPGPWYPWGYPYPYYYPYAYPYGPPWRY